MKVLSRCSNWRMVLSFLMAFLVGQALETFAAYADHGTVVGQNRVCSGDGDYYHTHWYRDEGNSGIRNIVYKINIINEYGVPGVYASVIREESNEWNAAQNLIELIETTGTHSFNVTVDNYGVTTWTGDTQLDPYQCNSPQSNQSTHINDFGSSIVKINSFKIETSSSNKNDLRHWTASHELGHILGLGHNATNPITQQVMYVAFQSNGPTGPMTRDINQLTNPEDDTQYNVPIDPQGHIHSGGSAPVP